MGFAAAVSKAHSNTCSKTEKSHRRRPDVPKHDGEEMIADSLSCHPERSEGSVFAQLITQYRQQRGMSQGQLAQATRLSRTYIYHLEAGMRSNPSPHVAQSLARALGLDRKSTRLNSS